MTDNNPLITYVLDPSLPFSKRVPPPPVRRAQLFSVRGYLGGGFDFDSVEGRAANCFYAVNEAIEQGIHSLGREFTWAKVPVLDVRPEAGFQWNAYYNRRGLYFFFNDDKVNGRRIYTSSAAKIVLHESGHAVLDAIRPDMWGVTNFEVWAFHEGFSDLWGFLCSMRNAEILESQDRRLWTDIGVEFASGLYHVAKDVYRPLRSLAQRFDWVDPTTLPRTAPDDQLSTDPHSFSRVFSSAIYAVFNRIVARIASKGTDPVGAIRQAADTVARYLVVGASLSAIREFYTDSICRAMMFVDWREGYPYLDLMSETFNEQKILQPKDLSAQGVVSQNFSNVCLAKESIGAQSYNPLHHLSVTIGHDDDSDRGRLLEDVRVCLDHLHHCDKVDKPNSPFATWKGSLIRRHFECSQLDNL